MPIPKGRTGISYVLSWLLLFFMEKLILLVILSNQIHCKRICLICKDL